MMICTCPKKQTALILAYCGASNGQPGKALCTKDWLDKHSWNLGATAFYLILNTLLLIHFTSLLFLIHKSKNTIKSKMRKGTGTIPHSAMPIELLTSSAGWSQKLFASCQSVAKKLFYCFW